MSDTLNDVANILARDRYNREVTDAALAQRVLDTLAAARAAKRKPAPAKAEE